MSLAERRIGRLSRDTYLLALTSLFADVSTEMLVPILPIYLTQTLKASGAVVGVVQGVANATQYITQGLSGAVSDKLRSRKPIALAGYLLTALGKPLMGLATAWPGVLGGRVVDRLGAGVRSAPRDALIAASVDPKDRGRAFGLEGLGDNAGAFIGPLLAVLCLMIYHVPMRHLFFLAVIPGLIAFALTLFVQERGAGISHPREAARTRFPSTYWRYLAAIAVFEIGDSGNAFLILRTKNSGASLTSTVLVYAGFNLVAALASYPAGSWSDRIGRRRLLVLALGIFFVTYLGLSLTASLASAAPLFILYGIHEGIFRAVGKALATDCVPPSLHASAIGWYNTIIGVFGLVAGLIAGWLWDRLGPASVFLFGAAAAAVGALALVLLVPSDVGHHRAA